MHVSKLRLINVRGYQNTEISLSKGINIITGANNSGKTTILKSLYTLQSSTSLNNTDIRKMQKFCKVISTISDISENERMMFRDHKEQGGISAQSDTQVVFHEIEEAIAHTVIGNIYIDGHTAHEVDGTGRLVFPEGTFPGPLVPFPKFASETDSNFIYPFFAKRKTSYYTSSGSISAYGIEDDFKNLPSKIQKISALGHPQFKEFEKYCRDLLGFDIAIAIAEGKSTEPKIGIYVTDKQRIFLESMGEGVANILGLITILLTENNKLFLIEELENDIHPEVLKKILNLIIAKSFNNQFVISTHSNIVVKYLASLPETKLFYTEWTNNVALNEVIKIPTSTITECENTPQKRLEILQSLGYDLFDFDLHTSYLILEESSAERIIRDFLIPDFVPELHGKIRTIAAKGVGDLIPKFNDIHRLFLYVHTIPIYHGRAWIIADGDAAGLSAVMNIKKEFKSWPAEHFINFKQDNFEKYYPRKFQKEVTAICTIQDTQKKRELKEAVLKKVIAWASGDRENAKIQFGKSASEVISVLKGISMKLSPTAR